MGHHRQHSGPGAPACGREKRGQDGEALGRSRGGFSTKLQILVDGLGNPVRFLLTAGQEDDVTQAGPLIQGQKAGAYILDRAYESVGSWRRPRRKGGGGDPIEEEAESAS